MATYQKCTVNIYTYTHSLSLGFDIHIYTSHYHAEYNRRHDVYLGHRVIHALESAQWIKLASSSADLTIYAGDFNSEPVDVPYKMLRSITPLNDCWEVNICFKLL